MFEIWDIEGWARSEYHGWLRRYVVRVTEEIGQGSGDTTKNAKMRLVFCETSLSEQSPALWGPVRKRTREHISNSGRSGTPFTDELLGRPHHLANCGQGSNR
jgi:hypothetical protein